MGSAASTKTGSDPSVVISPRIEVTKKGTTDVVLDSLPLSDVGPGTIRYRHQVPEVSVCDAPEIIREDIPTGYFYHPKLEDYSELGDPANEETYKFIRVAKGPNRFHNKNIFYVSGIGFYGDRKQFPPSILTTNAHLGQKEQKIYGHRYYLMTREMTSDVQNDDRFVDGILEMEKQGELRVKMPASSTVKDVKRRLGQHFLCPTAILHINRSSADELRDEAVLKEMFLFDGDASITFNLSSF